MIDDDQVAAHRARGLNPNHPRVRGTAQNPDVFFQAREAANPFYAETPAVVAEEMERFAGITGRRYKLFDYVGAADSEEVVVIMGSGAETVEETVNYLNAHGRKVGMLKVRLFRPFSLKHFAEALPETVKKIAVLDRTKEPGAVGEQLYQDVVTALAEARTEGLVADEYTPRVVGGRYGLGSKEFTPGMVKAVYDELAADNRTQPGPQPDSGPDPTAAGRTP